MSALTKEIEAELLAYELRCAVARYLDDHQGRNWAWNHHQPILRYFLCSKPRMILEYIKETYPMLDVKQVQLDAEKEVREEAVKAAKQKLVTKLKAIASAKAVVTNLEREYQAILLEIGE